MAFVAKLVMGLAIIDTASTYILAAVVQSGQIETFGVDAVAELDAAVAYGDRRIAKASSTLPSSDWSVFIRCSHRSWFCTCQVRTVRLRIRRSEINVW
jgi:hypothetical protein